MKKLLSLFLISTISLFAALEDDLTAINTKLLELNSSIHDTNLSHESICAPLIALAKDSSEVSTMIDAAHESISSTMSINTATLTQLELMSANIASVSTESSLLGNAVLVISDNADAITIKSGLDAMLQLSSDIGSMADRIGLMADKILLMSDNIGTMADRILETQRIQSENLALTHNTILQTQTNMLELVSVAQTVSYNLSMTNLITQGEALTVKMMAVTLNPMSMKYELRRVRDDVQDYLADLQAFAAQVDQDQVNQTMYINADSLTALMNFSVMMTSFATALDGYVLAINSYKYTTSSLTLKDAMASMLTISSDIGRMSNSILLMADQILAMADNIGMQADQIILVQEQQNLNIQTTQASVLASQEMAINIIKLRALD